MLATKPVTVTIRDEEIQGQNIKEDVPYLVEGTVWNYLPPQFAHCADNVAAFLEGQSVPRERWSDRRVCPGDTILFINRYGDPFTAAAILGPIAQTTFGYVIGAVAGVVAPLAGFYGLNLAAQKLTPTPKVPKPRRSPTYSGNSAITTTSGEGNPIQLVYGKHPAGGQVLYTGSAHGKNAKQAVGGGGQYGDLKSYTIFGLSTGPIQSIDGITVPKNYLYLPTEDAAGKELYEGTEIKVNGNVLRDFAGSGSIATRLGTLYQDHMPEIEVIGPERPIGLKLVPNKWVSAVTLNPVVGMDLKLFFPQGWWYNRQTANNAGDRDPADVNVQVRARPEGATEWEYFEAHRAKSVKFLDPDGYTVPIRFQRGVHESYKSTVEVELMLDFTWDKNLKVYKNISGDVYFQSVYEIASQQSPLFPGIALLGINAAVAGMTGQIERVTTLIEGLLVQVDSPLSPDIAPIFGYSSNPAMCVRDYACRPEGAHLAMENINREAFWRWMKHCDETFEWQGTTVKNWALNYVIDGQRALGDHMQIMSAAGNAQLTWDGSILEPVIDVPMEPVQVFSVFGMGNITSFNRSPLLKEDRPNSIKVEYRDEFAGYRILRQSALDKDRIGKEGEIRTETLSAWGVTHPAQAHRLAVKQRNYNKYTEWGVTLGVGGEAMIAKCGDVVGIHHQIPDWGGVSGRVRSATPTQVQLDQDLLVDGPTFVGVMTTATGQPVWQVRQVVEENGYYLKGSLIDISPTWDSGDTPERDAVYVAGADLDNGIGPARLYRIIKVESTKTQDVKLTLVNFDDRVFIYDEDEAPPIPNPTPEITPFSIPTVPLASSVTSGVERRAQIHASDGSGLKVRLHWTNRPWPYSFDNAIYRKVIGIEQEFRMIAKDRTQYFEDTEVIEGWDYLYAISPRAPGDGAHRNPLVCPQHEVRIERAGVPAAIVR